MLTWQELERFDVTAPVSRSACATSLLPSMSLNFTGELPMKLPQQSILERQIVRRLRD